MAIQSFARPTRSPTAVAAWATSRPSMVRIQASRITTNRTQGTEQSGARQSGLAAAAQSGSPARCAPAFQDAPGLSEFRASSPIRSTRSSQACRSRTLSRTRQAGSARSIAARRWKSVTSGRGSSRAWTDYNFNEVNIKENGFLDEFRKAQANLQANIAAGRGNTFAYTGAPGTSPLPIFVGAYNARSSSQCGKSRRCTPARTGRNTTFLGFLAAVQPESARIRQHQHDQRPDR